MLQRCFTLAALAVVPALLTATAASSDANWPHWRGPLAVGAAPDGANPPVRWTESENVKWKIRIPGYGTSTPIVWGDRVFILSAIANNNPESQTSSAAPATPNQQTSSPEARPGGRRGGGPGGAPQPEQPKTTYQFVVLAYDRDSGDLLWQTTAREEVPHEGHHRDHGYASYSPVTDGEHLFVNFGSRGLYAFDFDGNLKWEKDLGRMRTRMGFGEGGSLALHDNTLVINWDHEAEDFIVAVDKRDGRELWRNDRDEITSWSTPLVVVHDDRPQVIVSATSRIRSYDLATGHQIWECGGMTQNVIPTPVAGHGLVYATSGFRGNALLAIRLGREGDLTDSDAIAWRHNRNTPYVPSPLLYQERLYLFSGNSGRLSSFDALTGKIHIDAENIPNLPGVYASPVAAANRLYLVGREGQTTVLNHADTVDVLADNKLDDHFDASPAISGNLLFLRGHQHLYCLAE
jgi:outer membrane protein assembly factor BamB